MTAALRTFFALVALTVMGFSSQANAQSTLLQGGPTAPGHTLQYINGYSPQPIVTDAGGAAGGGPGVGLSELGLTVRGNGTGPYANAGTGPDGTNLCDQDAPTTNPTGYHFLCFSPNALGGALLEYGAAGGAAPLPLAFKVNGVIYNFPFSGGGGGGGGNALSVATNAALRAYPVTGISNGSVVVADGYYTAGDMPPANYIYSPTACSLAAGAGDGGSQIPDAKGGCFLLGAEKALDPRQFGVVSGGADPNGNNQVQLTAMIAYNKTLHVTGTVNTPVIDGAGLVYGWTGTLNDIATYDAINNFNGLELDTSAQTGVCPAMIRVTGSGVHKWYNDIFNSNFEPYTGFQNETNGTLQFLGIGAQYWQGSCGEVTQTGTETQGNNVIPMVSTTGITPGMVMHNDYAAGIPYLSYVIYVGTFGGNPVVVLNQPVFGSGTQTLNFYNDPDGIAYGVNNTNAGGTLFNAVSKEYNAAPYLGDPTQAYGFALYTSYGPAKFANDLQIIGGTFENANANVFMNSGTGGIHFQSHIELDNSNWTLATSTSSTIAGTTMTIGGTLSSAPFYKGEVVTGTGITGFPIILSQLSGTTGGAGTYQISQSETVSTGEAIDAAQANPAAISMADNSGPLYLPDVGIGGSNIQAFDEGGGVPSIIVGQNYVATSQNTAFSALAPYNRSALVALSTDQTNVSPANATVDINSQNIPTSWRSVGEGGTGTWNPAIIPNIYQGPLVLNTALNLNSIGSVQNNAANINAYNNNYTALLADTGNDYVWNNSGANYTTTLPNNLPVGWFSTFEAAGLVNNTDTLTAASGALLNGVSGGSVVVPSYSHGTINLLTNSSGTNASYLVNYPGYQQIDTQTANFTFQIHDCGDIVKVNNGASNITAAIPIMALGNAQGCTIELIEYGTGTVTLGANAGTTVNGTPSPYSEVVTPGVLYQIATADGAVWGTNR